ncbi:MULTISPECIES: zinc-binding dehydrogenase [unclassified Polynucleobacter]|uniref:zinc-binding dehydrogenase n=1 Tax=unclassified Polynucleobacter TaxID=2640945 RepID=UPI0008CEF2C3|nr:MULTISPECIES: zinc-binding dehydrogenase [unclassified Polynucleobacter]OHC09855.1 MAG: acetoin dehydrogenase [Polynucleobacter sp. GWA2_45_21]HBK42818.1 acetoin dehydrogenase [Polynucleobacter sp.]
MPNNLANQNTYTAAAVLFETNRPLQILSNLRLPDLKSGQVLVKLFYSGVCHSQIMETRGRRGEDAWLPHLLGHEGSGQVIAIGDDVTKVKCGQDVILTWIKCNGIDAGGAQYTHGPSCVINAGAVTTFNQYAVVSENRLVPSPEGLPLDIAALYGCAIPTGAGIIINELKPENKKDFVFVGIGGIGLSALMTSCIYSPNLIIAVDISQEKLNLAKALGATHTVNASLVDPNEAIKGIAPNGVDYGIDASGTTKGIELAFNSIKRNGGICTFASHPRHGDMITLDPYELICGKQLRGSWGGSVEPDRDIPLFSKLFKENNIPIEKLISRRYSLNEINQALDDLESGAATRPLIYF